MDVGRHYPQPVLSIVDTKQQFAQSLSRKDGFLVFSLLMGQFAPGTWMFQL